MGEVYTWLYSYNGHHDSTKVGHNFILILSIPQKQDPRAWMQSAVQSA